MQASPVLSNEACINLEEYFVLWIKIPLEEFNTGQSRLNRLFNHQKLFNDESQCEEYMCHHVSKDDRIVLIINHTDISSDFLSCAQQLRQVLSIYIRCACENNHEESDRLGAGRFNKICGVFVKIDKLLSKIEFDQNQRRNQDIDAVLAFNVFSSGNSTSDRSSEDLNAEFLHSLLIMDVLLRMRKNPANSNQELIELCRNAYKDNSAELINIENFARTYTPNEALWWYTSNTFLFKILNKALRVDNIYLLYLFRSFITDLHVQLQRCQCTSSIQVYRGQLITLGELDHLQCLIGRYIAIKSFFSTSLNHDLAVFYLGSADNSLINLERILFEIDADPQIDGIKPFGRIAAFSAFSNEQEVLFMPRSIFQILDISFDYQNNLYVIKMILCSEKQNHLNQIYQRNRIDYGGGKQKETNSMTLGNVLQRMGKCDLAEMFYRLQLSELSVENRDDRLISSCFFNIAEVLREQGQYDGSVIWYQKSLDIDIKTLPENHPNIGNTYNSIGIIQEKNGDFESALDSYGIALKIALKAFGCNHTRVAICLNNTGNAYQALDNYLEALDCHRIALMIRQKNLTANHHRLAASHNNIGVVYHRLTHFDLAYEHYKVALQINRKSLPPQHCDIGIVVRNIALLRESEGNLQQALAEFEQEANRRRRQLPRSNHDDILQIEADIQRIKSKLL